MKYIIVILFCLLTQHTYSQMSVLNDGKWLKIGVVQDGVYKIEGATLANNGFDLSSIQPVNIKIYGNGGNMLPQINQDERLDDLYENAIYIFDGGDGQFNSSDYVLFYGQSPHVKYYDDAEDAFKHQLNIYSDTTYYFLTVGNSPGKRIPERASENAAITVNEFKEYLFIEEEQTNILNRDINGGSGRVWYGKVFDSNPDYTYSIQLEGIIPNSNIKLQSAVMAQSVNGATFTIQANGQEIGEQTVDRIIGGTYDLKGKNQYDVFNFNANSINQLPNLNLTYLYDKHGSNGRGYIDYFGIEYNKSLRYNGKQMNFRSLENLDHDHTAYQITNADNSVTIWDVSQALTPVAQNYHTANGEVIFGCATEAITEFVIFKDKDAYAPSSLQIIDNQNLHGLSTPHLLIITPAAFLSEAQRLAAFRANHDQLEVVVAPLYQIYNEFASGKKDLVALRDFIKYLYDQDPDQLKYVLLFGDASFDYKNILGKSQYCIPIYESVQSLHPIYSYSSDDFFGFMEEEEGEWTENNAGNHTMEIGIGRLPINNIEDAQLIVDKIIHYQSKSTIGKWRNTITFVADDGDANTHQRDADRIARDVDTSYLAYNTKKIFLDAYPQESTPKGEASPIVSGLIDKAIEKGTLVLNFTGHGGEIGWTEEGILDNTQVLNWKNYNKLPLMVTATCEFGRYDEPNVISGAEYALLSDQGGAIGLITTTRPVFSSTNFILNKALYDALFLNENGQKLRLGDIMKLAKNNSLNGVINRNFALLGDPSMQLNYPAEDIVITQINDIAVDDNEIDLHALSHVNIEGEIQENGIKDENFNGTLNLIVFEKARTITTKGTESSPKMNFTSRDNIIFQGDVSVIQGRFSANFIVPKDISYSSGKGKISMYAYTDDQSTDAHGANQQIIIGGSSDNIIADHEPPEIKAFLDDLSFNNGGIVGNNTLLIVQLADESGINISNESVGHEILATLDGTQSFILNEFYQSDLDTYQSGSLYYTLNNLEAGPHELIIRAWDTHNNSSEISLSFIVRNENALVIENLKVYPNPSRGNVTFQFDHNHGREDIEVDLQVFDIQGSRISHVRKTINNSNTFFNELTWDGTNNVGSKLNNGMYTYKISVRSINDGLVNNVFGKLIIIR